MDKHQSIESLRDWASSVLEHTEEVSKGRAEAALQAIGQATNIRLTAEICQRLEWILEAIKEGKRS